MRGLVVPEPTEDFTADPVELFFDLAYVFAFSPARCVLLVPTRRGTHVGESALIFLLLWLPWSQFTWSANAVSGNYAHGPHSLFLIGTVGEHSDGRVGIRLRSTTAGPRSPFRSR